MFNVPESLDEPFVHAIRAGLQRFEAIQQQRLGGDETSGVSIVSWSSDYHSVASLLANNSDNDVNVLWSLTTMVLQIGLQGERSVNASQAFELWYNSHFVDVDATRELLSVFTEVPYDEPLDNLAPMFRQICQLVLRLFAFGRYQEAAELMHNALTRLRQEPGIDRTYLDEPAEQRLADVMRLLKRPSDEGEFIYWRECAHRVTYDARIELLRPTEDPRHPAALLKFLALQLVVAMTGDPIAVKEASEALGADLNVLDYACCICCAIKPFLSLSQLSDMLDVLTSEADPMPVHHWYFDILREILLVREKEQMTLAMLAVYRATLDENFEREAAQSIPESVPRDEAQAILFRRAFCLRFMAAHVGDLCASIGPGDVTPLFLRHELMGNFISTYLVQPELLILRLRYCAYSVLMDPHVTYTTFVKALPWALQDKRYMALLERTVNAGLDEASALQKRLYDTTRQCLPHSATVKKWFHSFYDVVREGVETIQRASIVQDLQAPNQRVGAIRLAGEIQRVDAVEEYLLQLLQQQDFFSCATSRQLGEAVHNGHLVVQQGLNPKVLAALEACATVFDAYMLRTSLPSDPLREVILNRALASCAAFCRSTVRCVKISTNAQIQILEAYIQAIEALKRFDDVEAKASHLLICNTFAAQIDSAARSEGDDFGGRLDALGGRVVDCLSQMVAV